MVFVAPSVLVWVPSLRFKLSECLIRWPPTKDLFVDKSKRVGQELVVLWEQRHRNPSRYCKAVQWFLSVFSHWSYYQKPTVGLMKFLYIAAQAEGTGLGALHLFCIFILFKEVDTFIAIPTSFFFSFPVTFSCSLCLPNEFLTVESIARAHFKWKAGPGWRNFWPGMDTKPKRDLPT